MLNEGNLELRNTKEGFHCIIWGKEQQECLFLGSKILEWNSYLMALSIKLLSVVPLFSCVQVKDETHHPL
jgi:hypothetical protein